MDTEMLERAFTAIGARIKINEAIRGTPRRDVRSDGHGEFLELRFTGRGHTVNLEVVEARRGERHVLVTRDGNEESSGRVRHAFPRRGTAYARQGEWYFVPAPGIDPPVTQVLFDEPLRCGPVYQHIMQFAYRRGARMFAKGAIRHPDHATLVLRGWHRVARAPSRRRSSPTLIRFG